MCVTVQVNSVGTFLAAVFRFTNSFQIYIDICTLFKSKWYLSIMQVVQLREFGDSGIEHL